MLKNLDAFPLAKQRRSKNKATVDETAKASLSHSINWRDARAFGVRLRSETECARHGDWLADESSVSALAGGNE